MRIPSLLLCGLAFSATGCCIKKEPPVLDLAESIRQIKAAIIAGSQSPDPNDPTIGLVPSEATVVLAITAAKEEDTTAGATIGGVGWVPITAGASYTYGTKDTLTQANTITIKFSSAFFAAKDAPLISLDPKGIADLLTKLKKNVIGTLSQQPQTMAMPTTMPIK